MQIKENKINTILKSIIFILILVFTMGIILTSCSKSESPTSQSAKSSGNASEKANASGENLVIPINEISSTAKFYSLNINGTEMEVLAVKAPDGSIRTAFNTCQVCYSSGRGYYKQRGDFLVCQNCGNKFPMNRVGVEAGGCNPWSIFAKDKTVTEESITISYNFLKASNQIFANWKTSY